MNRTALADFLRRHREALKPRDVGLLEGSRRRTPGLKREEVALLVGMSTDYYSRLEQQRGPQPSEQMVAAIARGLRLTLDERDHLFRLAGHTAPRRARSTQHVSPALMRVLDRLDDTPAMVLSDLGETLAQNAMATALLGDETHFTGLSRSFVYRWFTDPSARSHYPERDHDHQSRIQVAALRAALSARGDDHEGSALVQQLLASSEEFAALWELHEVRSRFDDHKTLVHPEIGELALDCQALFTENLSQTLLVLTASPGTDAADKLALLSVVGHQSFV
ncbi:helix-turn-helix transcriptional regulator [Agreia sp. COWG]|uniref:helix-turn-helix transcriptional regulator n=1 Tax=Agreia sp. COWG TaxID=2773266 RepID=UPI001927C26C|nr:helix-turn-helix transcriptional regulator [Agreia sp. COWG]CAD6002735.1 XRE family transcriptional regulator [Agreia sp. COWG]